VRGQLEDLLGALGGLDGGAKPGFGATSISLVAAGAVTKTITAAENNNKAQNSTCAAAEEKTVTVTQQVAAAAAASGNP
jgi:hypothetical protein